MVSFRGLMTAHQDLELAAAQDSDLDALGDILSHAFGFPREDARGWFARAGVENLRVLRRAGRGGRLSGGLIEIPMGQWFGGRSVPMMGVAGVGVVPEERGRGVAVHLMLSMLRGARARGFALSTLNPASVTLYRRAGYERAGARFSIAIDPRSCELPRVREMDVAEVLGAPADVVALYEAPARRSPGYLDRGPYIWTRVTSPRGAVTKTFTVSHGGVLEGYVVLSHAMLDGDATAIKVTDIAATTSRAGGALLRLLLEYRSVAKRVTWFGGTSDLFTNLLPERNCEVTLADHFMMRVVDVARALSLRGWPRGASGSLDLEVADASMPENSGRYSLTLEDGQCKVVPGEAGTAPRVAITERGLAALYTGHAPAHVLAGLGWLEADDDARATLDAWFAGPAPTMRDFF